MTTTPIKNNDVRQSQPSQSEPATAQLFCTPMPNPSVCSYAPKRVDSFVHSESGRVIRRTTAVVIHHKPLPPPSLMRADFGVQPPVQADPVDTSTVIKPNAAPAP